MPERIVVENNFLLSLLMPPPPVAGQTTPQTEANAAIAQKLDAAVKEFGEQQVKQCLSGGACPGVVATALLAISAMTDNGDDKAASAPNVGQSLTDKEKAELGGAGSGTPGGWGPEDEEGARNKEHAQNDNFDRFKKDDLVSSANKPINEQGLSAAARAWEKHAGRSGGVFEPLKGNPVQKSEAANQFVNEVLNNKGTVKTDLSRGGVEYRLPNGKGIRYNSDGSFSGFLDPKKPR